MGSHNIQFGKRKVRKNQSRRGRLDRKEEESPGEQLRLEIRNAIRTELPDVDRECSGAKSH
jgi:hypothetical protein